MDEHLCLKEFEERWPHPFSQPIGVGWNDGSAEMKVMGWHIQAGKLSKSTGRLLKDGRAQVQVNYCPFCGEKLTEDDDDE